MSGYTFNETCQKTVPQAIICALEATSFEDAIRNAISIGGDSDTVGAITGGIAEGLFGVPDTIAAKARVPQSTLTRFLQGNPMTTDSLDRLAPVLGIEFAVGKSKRRTRKGGSR